MTPDDRKYAKSHEWVKVEGDLAVIGISDHAQDAMGDVTFVELPPAGKALAAKDELGVIESVKVASDVFAPVAGEVAETNAMLADKPELINKDPYGEGWLIKLKGFDAAALDSLMDAAAYEAMVSEED